MQDEHKTKAELIEELQRARQRLAALEADETSDGAQSDDELRRGEERWRSLVESAPDIIMTLARDGTIDFVNRGLPGLSVSEIVGRNVRDYIPPEQVDVVTENLERVFEAGEVIRYEGEGPGPDGSTAHYASLMGPILHDGRVANVVMIARDITERKRAAEAVRASEESFRAIFDGSVDGILLADPETRKLHMGNRGLCRMTGYSPEEIAKLGVEDIHPAEDLPRVLEDFEAQARGDRRLAMDIPVKRKDGSVFHADINTAPILLEGKTFLMGTFRDVTEKRQLQASLAQADRLASMGMLAAGVAHEINNPLAYILYNLDSLAKDLPQLAGSLKRCYSKLGEKLGARGVQELVGGSFNPALLDDMLDRVKDALGGTERIKAIARGLGTFSRVERDELTEVNLQYAIECAINMAYNEIKYRARLVKDYGDVPTILASDGRISQVFLNLLVNAAHAIDEGNVENNEIRVRTWAEGDDVLTEVSDTGEGIPPESLDRIFDAFFSTKSPGVGSGLGLSICHSIVTSYGGSIGVKSEVGRGTRFTIRLPARKEEVAAHRKQATAEEPPVPEVNGRILVVDDDAGIRAAITRVLAGHEVVAVASGEEAQSLLREDEAFDVVLCDMMMLKMSGMDLHRWLVAQNSALAEHMVFFTGGAFTPKAREYLRKAKNPCVAKPFDASALRALVAKQIASDRVSG